MNVLRVFLLLPVAGVLACSQQHQSVSEHVSDPSTRAAATAGPAAAGFPQRLQVTGTEPFWGVRVDGERLHYTTPETLDTPRRLQAPRRLDAAGLHFSGHADGDAFALDIERKSCSDGMSDTAYPYSAEFVLAGKVLKGCARDLPMRGQ